MKTLVMVLVCALPLAAQPSQQSDSAKAAAVVARHVAAIGGEAALSAMKQVRQVTVMSMSDPRAPEIRVETHLMAPNLVYIKTDMPGLGAMEMGFDGTVGWAVNPMTGPVVYDSIPLQLAQAADLSKPPMHGMKASYGGVREISGRKFDVVNAIMPDGQRITSYFDVATGLFAGMDMEGMPAPPGGMVMTFEDYKRFGRVLYATKVTTRVPQGEMVMHTMSIRHDSVDKAIFAGPPAVRELKAKKP